MLTNICVPYTEVSSRYSLARNTTDATWPLTRLASSALDEAAEPGYADQANAPFNINANANNEEEGTAPPNARTKRQLVRALVDV